MPDSHANGASRALLISPDARLAAELTQLVSRELPLMAVSHIQGYPARGALLQATGAANPSLCFLDMTSGQAAAFEVMTLAVSCCPGLPLVALLRANDPDLILQCLRQGASEFLIHPFTADQLHAALRKLSRFHGRAPAQPRGGRGRLHCVMPAKGACGASTVACNLAYALKRLHSRKVLLADLDGLTGTLPFLLKLKSSYSFIDALHHAGSLDADLWKALVTPWLGVDVLLSPENPVDSIGEPYDPEPLLSYTRLGYEVVVADCGGPYGEWNLALARACDELLLVTTNELPALHASQRVMAYLEDNGLDRAKVRLLVNRFQDDAGLRREEIETALKAEIFGTLPSDHEAVAKALMEGKAVAPGSRLGKSVTALAQRLAGRAAPAKKDSGLAGFLRKLSRA